MTARSPFWTRSGAGLLAVLAALFLWVGSAWAAETPSEAKVGFELIEIRNVNILSGQYLAEFNLSVRASQDIKPEGFQLENGRILNAIEVVSEPTYKVYRMRADLTFDVDTRKIPFDEQHLAIKLRAQDPRVQYVLDPAATPTDLRLSMVDWVPGKQLKVAPMAPLTVHGDASVFRYSFGVDVHRDPLWSILRFMLPALALQFSGFLVLILPDDFKSRLGMALASFIGQVFLQLSVGGRVPVRDTLPFWDQAQIISYLAISVVIIYLFVDNALKEQEKPEARAHLTTAVRVGLPTTWALLLGGVIVTTFW